MEWTKETLDKRFKAIIDDVEKEGVATRGKKELISYCQGKKLNPGQSIKAHCYQCMGYQNNPGESRDCENPVCPLYPYMPYSSLKPKSNRVPMSDEQKKQMGERMKKINRDKNEQQR